MGELLVVEGKTRLKQRGGRRDDITPEQVDTFFSTLAETCNVVRSAKAASFSANWAYRKRKTDAAFRAGWAAAVAEGYAKLELVLLQRAMNGTVKRVPLKDGGEKRIREYSNALAIALLKRHADLADSFEADASSEEVEEVRARILEKLLRLKERDDDVGAAEEEQVEDQGTDEPPSGAAA